MHLRPDLQVYFAAPVSLPAAIVVPHYVEREDGAIFGELGVGLRRVVFR